MSKLRLATSAAETANVELLVPEGRGRVYLDISSPALGWSPSLPVDVVREMAVRLVEWLEENDPKSYELYSDAADSIRRAIVQARR